MDQTKKHKKIKKVKIWPSVLGLCLTCFIMPILFVMVLSFYLSGITGSRFVEGIHSAQRAIAEFELVTKETPENEEAIFNYISVLVPSLEGMYILDETGNISESFGAKGVELSSLKLVSRSDAFSDISTAGFDVYVDQSIADYITVDGDSFTINSNLMSELLGRIFSDEKFIDNIGDQDLFSAEAYGIDFWFLKGEASNGVLAKYRFSFSYLDYFYILGIFIVSGAFFVALMWFFVSTIIRKIYYKSRMYSILYRDNETNGKNTLFFHRKAWELMKGSGKKRQYAAVNIRCEKFRSLRSCYGVLWAGQLSTAIYESLRKSITSKEVVCYMGDGDFGLYLTYKDVPSLNLRIKKIMDSLSMVTPGQKLYYSAGVCASPGPKSDTEATLNNAANARSTITDATAGEIKWFSQKLHDEQVWERTVEAQMQGAMERREFEMYLQPKYTANGEELGGAEALVRWIHPTEGFIPPGRFIPIFEKNGFITALDDYMISEVAGVQAKWMSEGRKLVPISVNVSRAHFMNEKLAEHIRDIVDGYGVPHEYVELELTESAFFDDKQTLIETVKKMQAFGFPVSMDDFGAGYSSLNSLKELPLDVIKLDADFFRGEESGGRGKVIVSETIDLAKQLGMHIVAEGIETREQVDFLKDQQCDLIQGYFFAKPMPVSEFEQRAYAVENSSEPVAENSEPVAENGEPANTR